MSFTRRLERRGATGPFGDSTPPPPSAIAGVAGSSIRSGEDALSLMVVLTCVGILVDSVSSLPLDVFTGPQGDRQQILPAPPVVADPFPEITQQDWVGQVVMSQALRGNFYGYVTVRDRLLRPMQVMPTHPDRWSVTRDKTGARLYRLDGNKVDIDDVVHIPHLTVPGALEGLDPITFARQGLALAKNAEKYGSNFFVNSAEAGGVLQVPGELDDDETRALALSWRAAHQGVAAAGLPAVLTQGVEWKQISITPENAQFLQTRDFQRREILGLFRIPPHMTGDVDKTTSWGTGIEQQEIGFVVNTLRPYLLRIEAALNRLLPPGYYTKFNLNGRLRGDTGQRMAAYVLAILNGIMSIDEVRELEDLPPLPDQLGKGHWFALNYQQIGQAPPAAEPAADAHVARMQELIADLLTPKPPPEAIRAALNTGAPT